jgi:hypothetical protein
MDNLNQNMPGVAGEAKKSYGALIAVILILVLMVIGGLYFLGQRMSREDYTVPANTTGGDAVTKSMNEQSNSDDVSSIEADLNATNIDDTDQGAAAIEVNAE